LRWNELIAAVEHEFAVSEGAFSKTPPMLQPITKKEHKALPALQYGGTLEEQN
jgi:hypothetical protein